MFNRLFASVLVLTLLAPALLLASGQSEGQETLTLRYADMSPPGHTGKETGNVFADIVAERTDGRIQIEVFGGGQLGGHQETITGVQSGAIDMARNNYGYLAAAGWEQLSVMSLPFLWDDVESAYEVLEGETGQRIMAQMEEELGVLGLGHVITPPRNFFFTDKRVTSLEDIAGMNLRVQPGQVYLEMVEGFGANAIAIDFSELYSALQSGVVGGAENPANGYVGNHFHEITDYYVMTRHQIDPSVIIINPDLWNSLSAEDQQIFREAMDEALQWFRDASDAEQEESMQVIRDAGVEILEVDDPSEWRNATSAVYERYSQYDDLIQEILAAQE